MTAGLHLLGELVTGWVGALGTGRPPVINLNRDGSPVRCHGGLAALRLGSVEQWRAVLARVEGGDDKAARKVANLARANLVLLGEQP